MMDWLFRETSDGRLTATYRQRVSLDLTYYQLDGTRTFEIEPCSVYFLPSIWMIEKLGNQFPSMNMADDRKSFSLSEIDLVHMKLMT